MARRSSQRDAVTVSTVELKRSTFYHELVSNGKVYARSITAVPFRVEGTIEKVYVRNGQKVEKGQLLAQIEDFTYRMQLEKAMQALEKARIHFKDEMLSNHGSLDTTGLNEDKMSIFRTRSGMADAELGLEEAEYKLRHTRITAPIGGVIADLEAKEQNQSTQYKDGFCRVIDNSVLEIKFPVLESEYAFVDNGMPVTVLPYVDEAQTYTARITNINPVVDENGMVMVTATMNNGGKLLEGMNVKIKIRKPSPDRLVVPKEALVIRQGRDVVFVRQDSLAIWKYVTTEFENSDSFSILEGLEEGDLVIYKGNVNLAHETVVKEDNK
jgi:RND family efflux transporter MFP subunit